ncbi:dUTP diphosphatase [endosymbiont GvMRE of Glomus versiforme]|uniref:dUTP diphosphatase n=1 Tax=endosymbiont GvMRE of Glomus versiforme TaxID=2039283 RepID=UPI000ECFCB66|nr:dUTP diphosphatase [endosymbiont GvMRE of Glomus versiforme]RHZ37184.1 DUTP diphosphatase [endosymbiont GvMRE of Glomus versiforme]
MNKSAVVFSQKTLVFLQEEQKKLDTFIHQQNKLEMKDTFFLRKIALFVEIGEAANELKTFKYWKKDKKVDLKKVQVELIDCLHFFLSLTNSAKVNFVGYRFQKFLSKKEFALNNLLLNLFERTKKLNLPRPRKIKGKINKTEKNYQDWLRTFEKLCWQAKLDEKKLLDVYKQKNKINQKRQLENLINI